jgi:hypothetical protein
VSCLNGECLIYFWVGIALAVLQQVTDINVIMYYTPSIYKSAGFGTDSALFQTAIMGLGNLTVIAFRRIFIFNIFFLVFCISFVCVEMYHRNKRKIP